MKVRQVTYSLGVKRSLPDYQNFSPFYSVTVDVDENETEEEVFAAVEEIVEARMGLKIDQLDVELGSTAG